MSERLMITKLRKQERQEQEMLKIRDQGFKLFTATPAVPLFTKSDKAKQVNSQSAKLIKQLAKRDKKLLEAAKLERESMAKISLQNQSVISKLQTELEQVLERRESAKPDTKRVSKRSKRLVSSHTTVSQQSTKPTNQIPRRSATVSKPDSADESSEPVVKRRYNKFVTSPVSDDNNNTVSSDSEKDDNVVNVEEIQDTQKSFLPTLLHKKVTHQHFSRSRTVHFTQLVSNLATTNDVDPSAITQDHKGEDR